MFLRDLCLASPRHERASRALADDPQVHRAQSIPEREHDRHGRGIRCALRERDGPAGRRGVRAKRADQQRHASVALPL